MNDLKAFGSLIRERRTIARLSQEAVAASAFGNASRKGYISTIENGLTKGLKPQTVQRLADALDIPRDEVPRSLRWPLARDQDRESAQADHVEIAAQVEKLRPLVSIIEEIERSTRGRVSRSPTETYRQRLLRALDTVTVIFGQSFSARSFALSLTIAYVYLFFAGVLAYAQDGGGVGDLDVFRRPGWADPVVQSKLAAAVAILVIMTGAISFFLVHQRSVVASSIRPRTVFSGLGRARGLRVLIGGGLLGCCAVLASQLGVDPVVASIVVVILGLTALADLGPRRSGTAGAIAGTLAGLIENLASHKSLLDGLEGALFGFVLGSAAFYVGAHVARRAPTRLIGGLSGAGVGVCVGALITMGFFALLDLLSPTEIQDHAPNGQAFDPLAPQDRTFVILAVIWVLFPVANALQDYLSYGLSKALADRFLAQHTSLRRVAVFTVFDLSIAVVLALATLASVFGVVWLADQLFHLDLSPHGFVAAWWRAPFGEGLWLSAMILSTLSWSVLHYTCVILPSVSAHVASGRLFGRVRQRVLRAFSERRMSFETYALSFAPTAVFVLAYLAALLLSLWLAWLGARLMA